MFVYVALFCFCLIASNVEASTNSASSMTNDTCYTSGLWTIWFSVNATQNAYSTLVQIANATCQSSLGAEFGIYETRSADTNTVQTLSAWTELLAALARVSSQLNGRDFTVRFCCVVNSSNSKTTGTSSKTTTKITTTVATNSILKSLDGSTCGKQSIPPRSSLTSRIFGGTDAVANSWPWMIIFYQVTKCSSPSAASSACYTVCGGTIISNNYILTAAHCIDTTNVDSITIIAGMHQQSSTTESNTRQVRSVSNIYIHPNYDTVNYFNDIALIRVNISFAYTTYVQPACLPVTDPTADDEVIIAGWGTNRLDGEVSDILKQAYTTVIGDCSSYWTQIQESSQICVANLDSGDSACHGDSGGPLLYLNNNQYVVAGVASYGYTCNTAGTNNLPNVYTRVSNYKTWIKSVAT